MQTQIIIFGKQSESAKEVFDVLAQFQNWEVAAITDVEVALEKMHRQKVNMVILTKDAQSIEESKLRKIGTILNEEIIFLHHSNQPAFKRQIVAMLNKQRLLQPSFAVMDNTLKNAHTNVSLN
ncbi:MAG TPA: hypothetical protein VGB84_10365 [Arachidicoccus sp.]